MRTYTTLGARGQMVVPAAVRKQLGLVPGQRLRVEVADGKLTVTPVPEDLIERLMGSLAGGPPGLEDLRRDHIEELEREDAYYAAWENASTPPPSLRKLPKTGRTRKTPAPAR